MSKIQQLHADALATAKAGCRWLYRHRFIDGSVSISCREPTDHTLRLTTIMSTDFAKKTGTSPRTALANLKKLALAGKITQLPKVSNMLGFQLLTDDAKAIGREIISELRVEGIQFEDERIAAQKGGAA